MLQATTAYLNVLPKPLQHIDDIRYLSPRSSAKLQAMGRYKHRSPGEESNIQFPVQTALILCFHPQSHLRHLSAHLYHQRADAEKANRIMTISEILSGCRQSNLLVTTSHSLPPPSSVGQQSLHQRSGHSFCCLLVLSRAISQQCSSFPRNTNRDDLLKALFIAELFAIFWPLYRFTHFSYHCLQHCPKLCFGVSRFQTSRTTDESFIILPMLRACPSVIGC